MAAEIALLSAGTKIGYAAGATRPTKSYTDIPQVVSLPEQNEAPNMIDVTRLSSLHYTEKIGGLIDIGGSFGITANLTNEFITAWEALVTASNTQPVWFCIQVKGITKAYYFRGKPQPLGAPGAEPNAAIKITANIAVEQIVGWEAAPTA